MKPLFLIVDGMSQAYRAYYAIHGLSTSKGVPTNATYGFALMLKRLLEKYPPGFICVAFDSQQPTVRHAQYALYKATRKPMPSDLRQQVPHIKDLCRAMNIAVIEMPGFEADDIIGTIARKALAAGLDPVIVTLDKDMMQLIDGVRVLNTSKDDLLVDREKVRELFGVYPEQITDLLAIWGDSSDNIPGAPGIGEKGARDLIQNFGSLEACYARLEEIEKPKVRASLADNRDQIFASKQLVTIDTNLPIGFEPEAFRKVDPDRAVLLSLLRELEFHNMVKEYLPPSSVAAVEAVQSETLPPFGDRVAFHVQDAVASIWTGDGAVYAVPLDSRLAEALGNPVLRKVGHDIKRAMHLLRPHGLSIEPPYDDTMLMAFLLHPNRGKYELPDLALEFFNEQMHGDSTPWIDRLARELRPQVHVEVERVYSEIEIPLVPVLAEMETTGIRVDPDVLKAMSAEMDGLLRALTERIFKLAGQEFNINSPRQLGEILFDKMNLPAPRRLRKSGQYSTAIEVLEELAQTYEMPRLVLEYRQIAKLKSTYADVIPSMIDSRTGRLHTSFHQTGAATGRLSSSDPNLQNIPVRSEAGRKIRRAFVPEEGWWFVSGDYSQVELRILAHLSGDERLADAFQRGDDIHRRTAAEVLGVSLEQVKPEDRDRAKAVNFGIVYGQTPYGLAQQLGISPQEAQQFIERYFERYPGVPAYIESRLRKARDTGVVRTMFGRLRQIPEINAKNGMRRGMAERTAINSPIQGSAADIIKLAMIRIARELRERRLRTRMVLQVHDELIFEVPEDELTFARDHVREWMQSVVELSVPLTVDIKVGRNWEEMR